MDNARLDALFEQMNKVADRVDAVCATLHPVRHDADRYEMDLKDNEPRVAVGVKGMKSTPWRKKFPNQAALDRFLDSEEASDYTLYSIQRP
jgi:hypothetical protein